MKFERIIIQLIDWIYSLLFCCRVFPLGTAIYTPVNISHNVKIGNIFKGSIEIKGLLYHNKVFIGHQGYSAIAETKGLLHIKKGSKLILEGTARFVQGLRLWIENDSQITVGDNFYCNKNCLLRASEDIFIGKDVLFGWNIEVNTDNGHTIVIDGVSKDCHAPIFIGNHVWVASYAVLS